MRISFQTGSLAPRCFSTLCRATGVILILLVALSVSTGTAAGESASAQLPQFHIVKPSTTGVPGEEVRVMTFDPQGNLWIAARYYFWQEWGLAMLSADQFEHHPLPGGGYDTRIWKVWSSVNNPLPSQYMYDMKFGNDGTIWLASDGGLTRFRPNAPDPADRWFTYTPSNSPLVHEGVRSIAIDSQGNIWIVNEHLNNAFTYLFKLNPATGQWTTVNSGQYPYNVAVGVDDHVFISMTMVGGIMEFDGDSWVHHPAGPIQMSRLTQDDNGNVWAIPGYVEYGLWKWNGKSWHNWPQIGGTITITGISKNNAGDIYISTWYGGIYKMINDEPVFFVNADNIPGTVLTAPNGDIFINNYGGNATMGGVRHYTAAGQLLSKMQTYNTGLPDYIVDRIMSDSSGNMWFATGEGGVSRMLGSDGSPDASTRWRNWGAHNFGSEPYPWAPSEPIYDVFEDDNGIFWMAGNGVGRWNSATGEFTNFWNSQNSNLDVSGMNVIIKRGDTMWVGTGGSGVSWLNGNNWTRVTFSPTNYDANHVNAMAVDTANNLWVASNYGLRKFAAGDNANFTEYGTSNSPLPSDYILDVEPDPAGGVWIGTTAGLVRFNGGNWTIYNQANTGMPGTSVSGIARRPSDGLIAIANNQGSTFPYSGGVSTFNGATWTHYTPENSPLPHWQVVAVEFDVNGNLWASPLSTGVVQIMIGNSARRAPYDFDGDGKSDVSIFRPSAGEWWYRKSSDGQARVGSFGSSSDVITPGDFTGDGKTDLAFFRPAEGRWYVLRSDNDSYFAIQFGQAGDIPMPADFDGDGKTDAAVFRPSEGLWFILRSSDTGVTFAQFGTVGDQPVAADYDGDGKADIAIVRNITGNIRQWWIQRTTLGIAVLNFGVTGDITVPGDYTGDGKTDVAVFHPNSGQTPSEWYILRSEDFSYFSFPWGQNGDVPVPADYDGDGKFEAGVFRPSDQTWYINQTTGGPLFLQFGLATDRPVPSLFVR